MSNSLSMNGRAKVLLSLLRRFRGENRLGGTSSSSVEPSLALPSRAMRRLAASRGTILLLAAASLIVMRGQARGDSVQLVNGDVLRGKVVSLSQSQLVFHSETFGEIKIDRAKVDLIGLGAKPLPTARPVAAPAAAASQGLGSLLGGVSPLLGTPGGQKNLDPMVEQLLGAGGVGDLQKNVDNARRGLQDLKKDLGSGPESQALDAYINLLNQFGTLSAAAGLQSSPSPHPPTPHAGPHDTAKKPDAVHTKPAK